MFFFYFPSSNISRINTFTFGMKYSAIDTQKYFHFPTYKAFCSAASPGGTVLGPKSLLHVVTKFPTEYKKKKYERIQASTLLTDLQRPKKNIECLPVVVIL